MQSMFEAAPGAPQGSHAARAGIQPCGWRHALAPRRIHGPWQVRDARNNLVATVFGDEAEARLIAASPRLRSALAALVRAGQSDHARAEALAQAQALLREVPVWVPNCGARLKPRPSTTPEPPAAA